MSNGTEILLQALKDTTQMKTEFQAKFLQHLTQKKKDEGFTLIELLVVIIIIGILSAIALPSFLNQAAKARASEARTNVGALNRAQQSHYLENQTFTTTISALGVGIKDTDNYSYAAAGTSLASAVTNTAKAINADLKGYAGGVFKEADVTTSSILCEASSAGTALPAPTMTSSSCGTFLKLK